MRTRLLALTGVLLATACGGPSVDPETPLTEFTFQEQDVPFVNADDLHAWMEAGHEQDVIFVDNRNAFAFDQLRIEGSRLMPTDRVDLQIGNLPLNKWLIFYCT